MKISNRLVTTFQSKPSLLSLYITAGFPKLTDTAVLLKELQKANIDFVEVGLPFSDSLMDGPTIQHSHQVALENGMTLEVLMEQLDSVRSEISYPLVLMGALNPIFQFGVERFCERCHQVGIDGVLIPDLTLSEYQKKFKKFYQKYHLAPIFMVTPRTSEERLLEIDAEGSGFLYVMSSSSTTGAANKTLSDSKAYLERIQALPLRNPKAIGFNISTREEVEFAHRYGQGAIVGSAFIRKLQQTGASKAVEDFVKELRLN